MIAVAGCQKDNAGPPKGNDKAGAGTAKSDEGPIKVKVAYLGLTCEAPIFAAYENGYFKDEGLDVELVKTDWNGLRDGLGLGRFDANHTLVMFLLKPIEQGLDVKITGGIHTGCLRVQAGAKTDIKTVEDLKGKRIGVPNNMGSPPCLFATRVVANHKLDPKNKSDVEWVTLPPDAMAIALEQGKVDAVATSEPMGSIMLGKNLVRTIADQAIDDPYNEEYCCVSVVSGAFAKRDPAGAAKVTRALLKGAKWVDTNPTAAAKMSVEKKYISASAEMNAQALSKLHYTPGVAKCRSTLDNVAKEMKSAGLLESKTDPAKLAEKAWLSLDGVTDEWLDGLKIEKVAGGGAPPMISITELAALFEGRDACCLDCCPPDESPLSLSKGSSGRRSICP